MCYMSVFNLVFCHPWNALHNFAQVARLPAFGKLIGGKVLSWTPKCMPQAPRKKLQLRLVS